MTPYELDALWQRAGKHHAEGELDAARGAYREILASGKRPAMVQLRLSQLEQQAGRYCAARTHALQSAAAIMGTARWEALAFVTSNLLVFDEREVVRQLIESPAWDDPRILRQTPVLSQQLWLCGDEAAALRMLDIADRRVGSGHLLAYSRAMASQQLGRIEDATVAFEDAIRIAPEFALAHWSLAYHVASSPRGERVPRVRSALNRSEQPEERAMLHYALYKELSDAGDDASAWPELEAGAALMRGLVGYSPDAFDEALAALLDQPPQVHAAARDSEHDRTPVFIVGMPRTGTTLLARIVGAHPAVRDAGELNSLEHAIAESIDQFVDFPLRPEALDALRNTDLRAVAQAYHRRTLPYHDGSSTHLIDKSPMNVFAAGVIAQAMPQARILCLVRGAMDTCYSNLRQLFQNGAFPYSYDQHQLAERYHAFLRVVEHWQRQLPENFRAVSYEALVQDPAAISRQVMDFCGLEFDPAFVNITNNTSPCATASSTQIRQPIHAQGIGEWRRHEDKLQPLVRRLRELGIPL